jgi:hypothetical protein
VECWLRVSVPDRSGALGVIAVAVAAAGADIRFLDVVTVEDGIAVDDLIVDVPGSPDDVRRALESLDGVVVEVCRPVPRLPGPTSALAVAARLAEAAPRDVLPLLVQELPRVLHGTWCAALRERSPRPEVLAQSIGSPSFATVETPWLPLTGVRRLDPAPWMPRGWYDGHPQHTLAAAPLGSPRTALLLGRRHGPRFYVAELADLAALARLAAALVPEAERVSA